MSKKMATLSPKHFLWRMDGDVAVIQLNRPDRKNPLTFDSYAELRDTFRNLRDAEAVLRDGTQLPVSRPGYARLKALLGENA